MEIAALLSPISRVTVGHDNDGVSAGWYCEKVKMRLNSCLYENSRVFRVNPFMKLVLFFFFSIGGGVLPIHRN